LLLRASVRKRISGYRANRPFPRAIKCHAVKLFHAFKDDETISGADEAVFPSLRKEPEANACYQHSRSIEPLAGAIQVYSV
jgi:hypothetical protein